MERAKLAAQTFNYDQISEICTHLRAISTVNESVRERVLETVQEVKEAFARRLEHWWNHGLDAEAQALVERLLEALNVLAEGPTRSPGGSFV